MAPRDKGKAAMRLSSSPKPTTESALSPSSSRSNANARESWTATQDDPFPKLSSTPGANPPPYAFGGDKTAALCKLHKDMVLKYGPYRGSAKFHSFCTMYWGDRAGQEKYDTITALRKLKLQKKAAKQRRVEKQKVRRDRDEVQDSETDEDPLAGGNRPAKATATGKKGSNNAQGTDIFNGMPTDEAAFHRQVLEGTTGAKKISSPKIKKEKKSPRSKRTCEISNEHMKGILAGYNTNRDNIRWSSRNLNKRHMESILKDLNDKVGLGVFDRLVSPDMPDRATRPGRYSNHKPVKGSPTNATVGVGLSNRPAMNEKITALAPTKKQNPPPKKAASPPGVRSTRSKRDPNVDSRGLPKNTRI